MGLSLVCNRLAVASTAALLVMFAHYWVKRPADIATSADTQAATNDTCGDSTIMLAMSQSSFSTTVGIALDESSTGKDSNPETSPASNSIISANSID